MKKHAIRNMKPTDFTVGQVVWVRPAYSKGDTLTPYTVTRIARKYVYVQHDSFPEAAMDMEFGGIRERGCAFLTEDGELIERGLERLRRHAARVLSTHTSTLTPEQQIQLADLLDVPVPEFLREALNG